MESIKINVVMDEETRNLLRPLHNNGITICKYTGCKHNDQKSGVCEFKFVSINQMGGCAKLELRDEAKK